MGNISSNLTSRGKLSLPGTEPRSPRSITVRSLRRVPSEQSSSSSSPAPPQESTVQPGVILSHIPDPLDGRLLMEERIASGQHSDLYKGVWALSDHDYVPVAFKRIRLVTLAGDGDGDLNLMDRLSKRISRETSVWKAMEHPNILRFYGYQTRSEEVILVSMWSEKRSLNRFLAYYPRLTVIDKLELLHEAAQGLAYLHSLQPPIAHGGIKPENVIITEDLHAVLCDVGVSRVMTNLGVRTGLTTGGQGAEFVGYQAPELYEDGSRPTTISDVYAFGGLILSTMSGKGPFWEKKSNAAVVIAIFSGTTPSPKDHPELGSKDSLWLTMRECWKSAGQRPPMPVITEELKARISQEPKDTQRARSLIPVVEIQSSMPSNSDQGQPSMPRSVPSEATPEESIFQPGAPIRDLLPQFKLAGTLVKMEKIGSGGYGDVFQGVWKKTNDELVLVAIKSIRGAGTAIKKGEGTAEQSDFMTKLIRETTIWKVAQHPNILLFYGYQIVDGEAMLVSPWCKNGSLNSYLSKNENLRAAEKLKLLCDAARGLAYLHASQPPIAHGDIKPENVIITDELKAALCDFGIARVMSRFTTGLTTRNPGAGTTRYQAKELLLDSSQPTNMSDVYAFGGLILATMSGKPPFHQHKNPTGIILAINQDQTPAAIDHPELDAKDSLWDLLRKCWKAQPDKRPSVAQVIRTLEADIRRRPLGPEVDSPTS